MTTVRTPLPDTAPDAVVYRSRRRQILIAAGMLGLFVLLWSQTQQPDYETHVKPAFSRYVWELTPFLVLAIVMAIRAFRVRLVTTADGIHVYRVLSHRFLRWTEVTGIEVHPTPTGKLAAVKLRLESKLTVTVWSFRLRKRDSGHSAEAEELAERLRADRNARMDGRTVEPWTVSRGR
jgi:hypothetical protein